MYVCVCVLVHVYASAHMCNRCVISVPRPHHCCQHVGSSACVMEDCFTEVIQLEPPSVSPPHPLIFICISAEPLSHSVWKSERMQRYSEQCFNA